MNVAAYIKMSVEKDNLVFFLELPLGVKFEKVYEALEEMKANVIEMENNSKAQAEAAKKEQESIQPEITE